MRPFIKVVIPLCLAGLATGSLAHESRQHASSSHDHNESAAQADVARGTVFEDRNGNGEQDRGERGIQGVSVSNGIDVVTTDKRGYYEIELPAESILFVSKPADYDLPVDDQQLPQFYYRHYPQGTPPVADFDFPVIEATGPLPGEIDFPLLPAEREQPVADKLARLLPDDYDHFLGNDAHGRDRGLNHGSERFRAMVFADTQASSDEELDMLREDIANELAGNPFGAEFGLVAGDVVDDVLSLYERHNGIMAQIGIPMFNVPGNHDMNRRSPDDRYATETFKSVFGPTYYSFDYGDVHFVALDNVEYKGDGQGEFDNTVYRGFISENQLQWLENDLKKVPKDKLLVIVTHIPLITYALDGQGQRFAQGDNINTVNLDALLQVIEPFRHVYGIAGHDTSNSWKVQVDHRHGWYGYPFIAHTLAEARGNDWSRGPRDERGVRAATMQDGNPNGYYVMSFDGVKVQPRFVPASGNPTEPMRITLDPPLQGAGDFDADPVQINRGVLLSGTQLVVNLFDGGKRDRVELSLDGGAFTALTRELRKDPFMERQYARYQGTENAFSEPVPSSHIWVYDLPSLEPGLHTVRVRTKDEFGQRRSSAFSFEVVSQ